MQKPTPPRLLTAQGQTLPLYQWAKRLGCEPQTIRDRLRMGWPIEKAVTTPPRKYGQRGNR